MPTGTRPATDRLLSVAQGAERLGVSYEYLRKELTDRDAGDPLRPPYVKRAGRWKVWMTDLDAWIDAS